MNTFFRDAKPSIVSYRDSQAFAASRSSIDEHLEDLAADVELIQSLGALAVSPSEAPRHPERRADAEAMAVAFRRSVGLSETDPFTAIARHAAGIGLLIFSGNLGPDAPDAGTALLRNGGVSLINSERKIGRRRLAAAHEIGHYLVQDEYTVDWRTAHSTASGMEGLLDAFARALLVPRNALERE